MGRIDPQSWKEDLPAFAEKTAQFYAGELDKNAYKGFSGLYGSYAQKGGQASMLRLRMTAGRVTQEKLAFVGQGHPGVLCAPGALHTPGRPYSSTIWTRRPCAP